MHHWRNTLLRLLAGCACAWLGLVTWAFVTLPSGAVAQAPCTPESEPNDQPETAIQVAGAACLAGDLPADDARDTWIWTVTDTDAGHAWTVTLNGISGATTEVQVLPISSAPGVTPIAVNGQPILVVDAGPDPAIGEGRDILVPAGRYLVGVLRTSPQATSASASAGYSITLAPGDPLPPVADHEPDDDPAHAVAQRDAFAMSGDIGDAVDVVAWKVGSTAATHGWDVVLQAGLGTGAVLDLWTPSGQRLAGSILDADGEAHLYDLHLMAGTYLLHVLHGRGVGPQPYVLRSLQTDRTGTDAEPNDDLSDALPLTPGVLLRGRLATTGDVDQYLMTVDASRASTLLDVRIITRSGPVRQVCVASVVAHAVAAQLKCFQTSPITGDATAQAGMGSPGTGVLNGLLLDPGSYLISVSGDVSPADPYALRVDTTSRPAPDFETEPDDDPSTAVPMAPTTTMHGVATRGDRDTFGVVTTGEPRTWTVTLTGALLDGLSWLDDDASLMATGDVSADRTLAVLSDVLLPPGRHLFQVTADGGPYTLTLTPQSPPDADAEREPNDDARRAEPVVLGKRVVGRLPRPQDVDVYRFSLAAVDHIRLQLTAPADGAIIAELRHTGSDIAAQTDGQLGEGWDYDALLEPGDYEIWLHPQTASPSQYQLRIDREDPFVTREDQEPDDDAGSARPMPPSLTVHGDRDGTADQDWFRLGSLDQSATLVVRTTGSITNLGVSDGTTDLPIVEAPDGDGLRFTVTAAPSGVPLYLHVVPAGAYTASVISGMAVGAGTGTPAQRLDAGLAVTLSTSSVAAYWETGQRFTGTVTITDTAASPLSLTLDAVTSHYAWSAALGSATVDVSPGQQVRVPITISVLPDAWADTPVRITVRARDASGAQSSAFAEVTPGQVAPPVGPYLAWSVPDALLGGLDVAALALGGTPVPSVDPQQEARLYDGVEHTSGAFQAYLTGQPVSLTSDLAGDAPVPIAGTIIDPLAPVDSGTSGPRAFQFQLSLDGSTWSTALTGEVSPLPFDQSFVLPAPVPARFARLVISSMWGPSNLPFAISEWKVIETPGSTPTPDALDVADEALGGHVVWADPAFGSSSEAQAMLRPDDPVAQEVFAQPGTAPSWVIGFQDDRMARLTGFTWVDPAGSDTAAQEQRVQVAISTAGPLGPWQTLGTWRLARSADGTVTPFHLATPTWARFVRFTGARIPKSGNHWEAPAVLQALESPPADDYRSIVGEWGRGDPAGPYEWSGQPAATPPADTGEPNDTPDTATLLPSGTTATGTAWRDHDVDDYTITTAAGQDSVTFTLGGTPSLGVQLRLFDMAGTPVPMTFHAGSAPGSLAYLANVQPGTTYRVRVEQPPFASVFAFDSSGSMTPYLPIIEQVKRAYIADRRQDDVPPRIIDFKDDRTQQALTRASADLAGREGARAVLVITDMELAGYPDTQQMWRALASVEPLVFVELVGDLTPSGSEQVGQDLAAAGHGPYDYVVWHAAGDRAFDRMAAWLRRPAAYSLSWTGSHTSVPPPRPGSLRVSVATNADGTPGRPPIARDTSVEIILDTSGSMLSRFGRTSRIAAAKSVLLRLADQVLPTGAPVAVRVFGDPNDACATRIAIPFGPLDPTRVQGLVDGVTVFHANDTPIGAALRSVPQDLTGSRGRRVVLLITDSQEIWPNKDLCGLDPAVAVRELAAADVRVDVVGLSITSKRAKQTMRAWTRAAGGSYFDARDPGGLARSLVTALSAPFDVFDASGTRVAGGLVGGPAVALPAGTYTVVVATDPAVTFDSVVVRDGAPVSLLLPGRTP